MKTNSAKNVKPDAWSASTAVQSPNDIINTEPKEKQAEKGSCGYVLKGKRKMDAVKRFALVINVVGGIVATGMLMNRASKCIQK